jgi:uncharacterized protein (TIGR00251 family)
VFYCRKREAGTVFKVHLTPRASRDAVGDLHGDAVKVFIKAPPVDNRANQALVKYLAKKLDVKSRDVSIVTGHTSRIKTLAVAGLQPGDVASRLGL